MLKSLIYERAFLFEERNFHSEDIKVFYFLANLPTSSSVTSLQTLLHIRSYTFSFLFGILGSIKMRLSQILVQLVKNTSNLFFPLL